MGSRAKLLVVAVGLGAAGLTAAARPTLEGGRQADSNYLLWTPPQAEQVGVSTRVSGTLGSAYTFRATWLTPEVIRATARLLQIAEGHNVEATDGLVQLAEAAAETVVLVEVVPAAESAPPSELRAVLQPKGLSPGSPGSAPGTSSPRLEELPALRGVAPRLPNAHAVWIAFRLHLDDGTPVLPGTAKEAELVLGGAGHEARVSWPIPPSLRQP